jgi:hypothetical protein
MHEKNLLDYPSCAVAYSAKSLPDQSGKEIGAGLLKHFPYRVTRAAPPTFSRTDDVAPQLAQLDRRFGISLTGNRAGPLTTIELSSTGAPASSTQSTWRSSSL